MSKPRPNGHNLPSVWTKTPGMLDRLKELHAQHCTLTKIANTINTEYGMSFSRSAISGKINRLGTRQLMRDELKRQATEAEQGEESMESEQPDHIEIPEPVPEPVRVKPPPMPPLSGGLALEFLDLTSQTCKWPFGDMSPYLFCGVTVEADKSYCPSHCDIAYNGKKR